MPISENMVQEIVQEVMAKMQIADAPAGKHGVFKDMWSHRKGFRLLLRS